VSPSKDLTTLEQLVESLIKMQGRLNEQVANLNTRTHQIEYIIHKQTHLDATTPHIFIKKETERLM
jgi:hypothetical protein